MNEIVVFFSKKERDDRIIDRGLATSFFRGPPSSARAAGVANRPSQQRTQRREEPTTAVHDYYR